MTIKNQLTALVLLITLFSIIVINSFFKLADSSQLHQLNIQHLKYVIDLKELISESPGSVPEQTRLRPVIEDIRTQPEVCLVMMVGTINYLIMQMTNTQNVVDICQNDVNIANQLLSTLALYEKGEVSGNEMRENLVQCYNKFRKNSISFIKPIDKIVNFIVVSTTSVVVIFSVIVLIITVAIARQISLVFKKMNETSHALTVSEEKNRVLAYQDPLTKLPNRNMLNDAIQKSILKSQETNIEFAVLFIDLDRFKDVNDIRGHAEGDKLLIKMAERISGVMRDCDSIIRFGGDEFVAVINVRESTEEFRVIAQRIIDAVSLPMILGNIETHVTASIGISVYPEDARDAESLLKYADTAMYEAKNKGKNQYLFYEQGFSKQQKLRLTYESRLRHAIEKDQLSLVYQPVVELKNNTTVGTEALLRWTTEEGELISPEVFIPIAENSGLIVEMGDWVLQKACEQNKIWQDSGAKDFKIAVNVSGFQLFNSDFPKLLQDTITRNGLSPSCVDIEITESMTVTENTKFLNILNELSEIGVRLLMDDFGTGYSCLSYLRQLPFDILKIDKSFLIDCDPIASTIIAMGKKMDMKLIAEGVETQQCLDFLNNQQCDFVQGYFFQHPIPASEVDIFKIY